jgi:hypothetical protein
MLRVSLAELQVGPNPAVSSTIYKYVTYSKSKDGYATGKENPPDHLKFPE